MSIDRYQSSVSLLMRFESNLNDASPNAIVWAQPSGAPAYETVSPKFGTAALKGSGNITNKVVTTPLTAGAALDIFAGDYTVEFWLYCGSDAVTSTIIDYGNWVAGAHGFVIYRTSGFAVRAQPAGGWGTITPATAAMTPGTWNHVALCRSGTNATLFLNGVPTTPVSDWTVHAPFSDIIRIGGDSASGGNSSYLSSTDVVDELRVTKGLARYTSSFAPPTVAFPMLPPRSSTYPTSLTDQTYWSDGVNIPPTSYSSTSKSFALTTAGAQGAEIAYVGDYSNKLPTYMYLDWALSGNSTRTPVYINYSLDGGVTYTAVDIGTGVASGASALRIATSGASLISFYVSGATGAAVTISTRTVDENCTCADTTNLDTLANMRTRMLRQLGFSAMVNNPPPGMPELLNELLSSAQRFLYRKYSELRTKRFFSWQMTPGTRFYCYSGNNEDMAGLHLDPYKEIEYVGVVLTNGAWIPLYEGIPSTVYTMVSKYGIPARYERRQCIEVFPAPNDYYQLVVKGHFGLQPLVADSDYTTIDSEAVFLYALAIAKAQYQKSDAATTATLAKEYIGQLVAGTHGKHRYVPGTVPTVPAVQPVFLPLVNP